ncbi:hypothetical protein QE369_000029 [Agrobacterium larrymoorei]|uniref:Uncharacterized protein n=1 Tax=Agrobacterium larrymoorei TaxID=160699 RepID=A0AAJ2EP95_9HYPH|nr:hypothetical protein [Agrobacterium larrymoorei]MDR6099851.1 hypothetical protein [Agrobacterium larrymoorei]
MAEIDIETIELTRACVLDGNSIVVSSVKSDADVYEPKSVVWRYSESGGAAQWEAREMDVHVEKIIPSTSSGYCIVLSSEGEVIVDVFTEAHVERIVGAGTWIEGSKGYGRLLSIARIDDLLFACGNGGQIYVRGDEGWRLLTDTILFDPEAHTKLSRTAPPTTDPGFLQWLMDSRSQRPRNISLHDVAGHNKDAVYVCGVDGTKPVLFFWDGAALRELKVHLEETALTGIYIENEDSVWICGREGVLLHGSSARGFTPVNLRSQLNLFHMVRPYRGNLVLPSSVRPGGLFEMNKTSSNLRRFTPRMPELRGDYIFHSDSSNDVLWVVGQKDIFRFYGNAWEKKQHPAL